MSNGNYTAQQAIGTKSTWKFILSELKPKGKLLTPFNIISAPIILTGIVLIVIRFWKGIGSITNLTDARYFSAWEVEWLGFNLSQGEENAISPLQVAAMREWVEGPKIVG